MPSFDVVSEIDSHELTNAVDQANREVSQRFDFKDTGARFELGDPEITLNSAIQKIVLRHGIDADSHRQLQRLLKESKLKLQTSIQGEQLRVTGKQRDDLQAAMALIRKAGLNRPLQFKNFRD
jgi:hypothetical protein